MAEGGELTYTAESSDPSVATVAVDNANDVLTITARSAGSATITVTAEDAQERTAKQTFTVTVPEPEPAPETTTTPEPEEEEEEEATSSLCRFPQTTKLTIKRTESVKCTLLEGYTLKLPPGDPPDEVLSADQRPDGETENVWLIRAERKGTHTITVFNAAQIRAGTITVIVPNTPPVRTAGPHPAVSEIMNANPTPYTPEVDIRGFFTDEDTEDYTTTENKLRYRVQSKPDWVLVESTSEGFVSTNSEGRITLDILRPMGKEGEEKSFTISIYAVDSSGDESDRPVRLKIGLGTGDDADINPSIRMYTAQQLSNGALHIANVLEIGSVFLRDSGTDYHTLTFTKAEGKNGFAFSYNKVDELIKGDRLYGADRPDGAVMEITASISETAIYKDRDNKNLPSATIPKLGAGDLGIDYYLLESTGVVKARWPSVPNLDGDPKVEFKLTGKGSGTIKISYYVAALSRGYTGAASFPTTGGIKVSAPAKTLTLRVVTCESPPDKLSDCPGSTS